MRKTATVIACGLTMLCGCSREHYVQGRGDAGRFILEKAVAYGGHPVMTNGLPTISGDWQYVEDEFGVGIQLSAESYSSVETYLCSAFGSPTSQAGWSVRDTGIAIYLQRAGTNTQLGIHPPMSEAQQARMARKIADTLKKNTQ